jgi:adenylate cyclase class 2
MNHNRPMRFEVEKKYWVSDFGPVLAKLRDLHARIHEPMEQADQYFAHPTRDFAKTDEALRLRRIADKNFVTYKGARIDNFTKTRQELELALRDGDEAYREFGGLLDVLGFRPVMTVRKRRIVVECPWQGDVVEVSLDEIDQLGRFVELEMTSDAQHLETAQRQLATLAEHLELTRSERRSYLELLGHQLAGTIVPV